MATSPSTPPPPSPRKPWSAWITALRLPAWMRRGKASAPTASVSSQLQKDLEEEQARLRREIEEISARLEAPPGTRPPAAPGDPARPTIWRENEEESFTRPVPETPSRGRLAIQRQIERNRFLVIACVLLVVALIFYRVVW